MQLTMRIHMLTSMLRDGHHLKILKTIVRFNSILVVDDFKGF